MNAMKRIKRILASEKSQMILLWIAVIVMMVIWFLNIWSMFPRDEKLDKQYEKIEEDRKKRAEMYKNME